MVQQVAYFVGLDLGQVNDFTALAVLERPSLHPWGPRPIFDLRHLQRFPLGTPYPQIVQAVRELLLRPALRDASLVVDQTGVGRAVVDMLWDELRGQVPCHFTAVTITGGHAVTNPANGCLHVPKKELVGAVQVLLQSRRLRIAQTLPEAPVLVKELDNFRVKITEAANETFGAWREGQHDDLVFATALAAFMALRV
jgi:hypothetical protein